MVAPPELKPTFRLRWHGYKNPLTAADGMAYRQEQGCTLAEAKRALEQRTPLVLQQWWEADGVGEWRALEVVVEPHPPA